MESRVPATALRVPKLHSVRAIVTDYGNTTDWINDVVSVKESDSAWFVVDWGDLTHEVPKIEGRELTLRALGDW